MMIECTTPYPLAPAKPGDAGVDLRAMAGAMLFPGERTALQTGVAVAIPPGHVGLVLPRSGLAREHGVATTVGVIDSGYRGEIGVTLINHGQLPYTVAAGDRVAQLVILPCVAGAFAEVDQLPPSERGVSGFGSTGR